MDLDDDSSQEEDLDDQVELYKKMQLPLPSWLQRKLSAVAALKADRDASEPEKDQDWQTGSLPLLSPERITKSHREIEDEEKGDQLDSDSDLHHGIVSVQEETPAKSVTPDASKPKALFLSSNDSTALPREPRTSASPDNGQPAFDFFSWLDENVQIV